MTYNQQKEWCEIMEKLPETYHFAGDYHPVEEWWDWKGHQVHLDCFRNEAAPAKVILLHGVGTNGRQMSMILGGPLSKDGLETIAIDMPTYGVTKVKNSEVVTYDDWVNLACDYIEYESKRDDRPIVLYGLSAGGMEAYHIASKTKNVKGIIGMTFLDQRIQQVRDETTRNLFMSRVGIPMATVACKIGLDRFNMKMSIAAKMSALCNDKDVMEIFNRDTTSAANKASMKFLDSYSNYIPAMEPEDFDVCPVLLTQPAEDRWTPLHLSKLVLDRMKKVDVEIVHLENGSHYPVEQPALDQMHDAVLAFIKKVIKQ
ncbi:alpha/beta hydrolase [Gracilibacillus salinarum]|uniref:Alpha/beta hydrolase n=1 Tax=Gracilibacillus salinarum TaxID=2932255 RepID=A0ABY4GH42_9BACI|nr:alpha/beta hydrolase [Gracilibacillus salinarum]UOQ83493.1 alpha/beta hydrolase [Gracilibacillus salinarum]